jgi:hypothetical protein
MATKLDKPLKREITIKGDPFVVTLAPEGFRLVGKGRRKGLEIAWEDLVSGEAALARALSASITGDMQLAPSAANMHKAKPARRRRRS